MPLSLSSICVAIVWTLATTASAQMGGAAFTTTKSGKVVNGNIYSGKNHVYLGGGPGLSAPCSNPGLPDGNYYFQVTDPSGKHLLSIDNYIDREITVSGGVITGTTGPHKKANGPCGSKTIQLAPFFDTPSAGNEYKVWVTPVGDFDIALTGFHGFQAKHSKTDNFKIKGPGKTPAQSIITGYKFYDFNNNGVWDTAIPQEVPIPGWRIEIFKAGVLDGVTFTNADGSYQFIRDQDGTTYDITEVAPDPGFVPNPGGLWVAGTPILGSVTASAPAVRGPDFGNLRLQVLVGAGRTKGFWHNNNGRAILQQCDPQWRTALNGPPGDPVCLRRNDGTIFTVSTGTPFATAFDEWENYIVGNPALGVGAFILSSQLAPALLSRNCGLLQGIIYVDPRQNGVLMSFEQLAAGAKALLCDPNANQTGPQTPYPALRAAMINCYKEFEAVNESGDPTKPQVVYEGAGEPGEVTSPYGEGFPE